MDRAGLLIFDGDDTLWFVEELYDQALERAQGAVDDFGLPGAAWRQLQREIDLENVKTLGVSSERFPLSSRQALAEIGRIQGVEIPSTLTQAVADISASVFGMPALQITTAAYVLSILRSRYSIVLLTKGDEDVQQRRIDDAGLRPYFDAISIVPDKNESVFAAIVQECDVEPWHAWSIGNSLASDINPAIRAGLNAIWIDAHVWEHERREIEPAHTRVVVLDSLDQVLGVLMSEDAERRLV